MYFYILLVLFVVFLPALVIFVSIKLNKNTINPLTKNTQRPPGCRLGQQLGGKQIEIGFSYAYTISAPLLALVVFLSLPTKNTGILVFCFLVGLSTLVYGIFDLYKKLIKIKKIRMAYECELAVGQELNQLMLSGFHVFHDVQLGKFNIDHVVIGNNGVFSVETKGRSKRLNTRGEGKSEYKVDYDKGVLNFPGWKESEPVVQAMRQSKQLEQWLSGAVGFQIKSTPVIILPGWFINIKDKPIVPVLAIASIPAFFNKYHGFLLNQQQLKQIVFQLDNKVRDIEPGQISKPIEVN